MRDKIKLVSSAGTGHYYTTTKNKRTKPDKIEIQKYDPVVRKHVAYKEAKIKQGCGKRMLLDVTDAKYCYRCLRVIDCLVRNSRSLEG